MTEADIKNLVSYIISMPEGTIIEIMHNGPEDRGAKYVVRELKTFRPTLATEVTIQSPGDTLESAVRQFLPWDEDAWKEKFIHG